MNAFLPLIAAVVHATSLVFDKIILSTHGVDYRAYLRFGYPLYFAAMVVLFLLFSPPLPPELFQGELLALFLASAAVMLVLAIAYYRALDDDGLGEVQTFDLLHYIPVVLVSALLFSDERNIFVVGAALVAAGAVFGRIGSIIGLRSQGVHLHLWCGRRLPRRLRRHLQRHYWHIGTLLLLARCALA